MINRLVPTGVAAREIGLSPSTLSRYVKAGLIKPDLISAGGHFRWDVERLRKQLADLQEHRGRDSDPD